MFGTIKRIVSWCGEFKGRLYAGFFFSFLSNIFAVMPIMVAAYTVGIYMEAARKNESFDRKWIWLSALVISCLIFLRFLFDYLRARFQETISYELIARDRLAVGDALKRVSLGYFQQINTGNILSSITTGLGTLENMGIRMIDNFVGGYLNFTVAFLFLLTFEPLISLIAIAAAAVSFCFLLMISSHSRENTVVSAKAERDMTSAAIEYARGLAVVKSFGQTGAAMRSFKEAVRDSRRIHLKTEWGFIPPNCLHLLALKCGAVGLALAAFLMAMNGKMDFTMMLAFVFFSFEIFAGIEPISDSAHVLSVIDNAMDQLDALKGENYIDLDGKEIKPERFDIVFDNVRFGYDEREILKGVSFTIPSGTMTAIVGPSGSGKSTICNLMARFYDVDGGRILFGGHDLREFTCDSLLSNISMVFQKVYLFHDTVRANLCFGKPDATEREMIEAAKKACCHEFIMQLPDGYDTVIGEGGDTLSGGQKQRISIARAILKNSPVIILDEATASIDPENEHLIQKALSELTKGKTVITIAHRLATIEQADQILVVDDGVIAEAGTHEELSRREGRYKKFIQIRQRAEVWKIS